MVNDNKEMSQKYDRIICLLEHLVAIELFRSNVSQINITRRLGVATSKVNNMLKGIQK